MRTDDRRDEKIVYWHRDLPPLAAEAMDEHSLEATSGRVPGTIAHRDELWNRCYEELMANASARLAQEVARPRRSITRMCTTSPSTPDTTMRPGRRGCAAASRPCCFGRRRRRS